MIYALIQIKGLSVKLERNHYFGHHGVSFTVVHFTVEPSDRGRLRELYLYEAKAAHFEESNLVVDLYERMLAKNRPCIMMVGISSPLTRAHADTLNEQRMSIANITGGVFAAAAVRVLPYRFFSSYVLGKAGQMFALKRLPTYHAGDVIISVDARTNGGIGPQHSTSSMIIKTKG
jgi:hypothetical protein